MDPVASVLLVAALLQFKHLAIDWMWQPAYEYQNKGTYGRWGGIRHSLKNASGTMLCFVLFATPVQLVIILLLDFISHYHLDWAKMNINRKMGWGPTTHEQFWWLTGLDQFAHQTFYLIWLCLVFVA